jgi:hypothetical protein
VDSFDLAMSTWSQLQDLPVNGNTATLVRDGPDLILVSPVAMSVMRFNRTDSAFYVVPGETPAVNGDHVTVVAVDDRALHGCT